MERLDEFIDLKRRNGDMYYEGLKDVPYIELPLRKKEYSENIYWVYGIVLKKEAGINAEQAMRKLNEKKIGTRPFFYPMHLQPVFMKMGLFKNESYPVSEIISECGFYIPSGLALSKEQIEITIDAVKKLL